MRLAWIVIPWDSLRWHILAGIPGSRNGYVPRETLFFTCGASITPQ
jgi:hypothetical protein